MGAVKETEEVNLLGQGSMVDSDGKLFWHHDCILVTDLTDVMGYILSLDSFDHY